MVMLQGGATGRWTGRVQGWEGGGKHVANQRARGGGRSSGTEAMGSFGCFDDRGLLYCRCTTWKGSVSLVVKIHPRCCRCNMARWIHELRGMRLDCVWISSVGSLSPSHLNCIAAASDAIRVSHPTIHFHCMSPQVSLLPGVPVPTVASRIPPDHSSGAVQQWKTSTR